MAEKNKAGSRPIPSKDRRSGIDRRWIKGPYDGEERRSGTNRRQDKPLKNPLLPMAPSPIASEDLEKLLVSATLQLEAITRILLKNEIIDHQELQQVLNDIRDEYHAQNQD